LGVAQDAFHKFLLLDLAPVLKSAEFSRSSNTFRKWTNDVCLIVNLQGNKWNTADRYQFTINLGVFSPAAYRLEHELGWTFPDFVSFSDEDSKEYEQDWAQRLAAPREVDCHWRERLGWLMPEPSDKWWELQSESQIPSLSREVPPSLVRWGLPAIERLASNEALRDCFLTGRSLPKVLLSPHDRFRYAAYFLLLVGPDQRLDGVIRKLKWRTRRLPMLRDHVGRIIAYRHAHPASAARSQT